MLDFAYFQEQDSEQFTFFRIPKVLFSDDRFRKLSTEAKLLYGIMLDRVSLSKKNGWVDENGNVYIIFTIEEMLEYLKWSRYRIFQLLDELDSKKGIGLIERKRIGVMQPNVIYVKNFASVLNRNRGSPEVCESDFIKSEQSNIMKSDSQISLSLTDRFQEVCQSDANNTDISNTEYNDTDINVKSESSVLYGSFHNVHLEKHELDELKRLLPYDWEDWIERLSKFIASSGRKYENHFATICLWAERNQSKTTKRNYNYPEGASL